LFISIRLYHSVSDRNIIIEKKSLADIAKNDSDPDVRKTATEKLSDQKLLANIAKNDSDPDVRKTATEKLSDQKLLADIAQNASDWGCSKGCIKKSDRP
ncbi:HEAT repeat domain-containing protein, partial [Desulfococcaceae bacterium HSG8]|nr:HEAT repeat domain-containing protein [Desulfococcaceae bacterium HSG8]